MNIWFIRSENLVRNSVHYTDVRNRMSVPEPKFGLLSGNLFTRPAFNNIRSWSGYVISSVASFLSVSLSVLVCVARIHFSVCWMFPNVHLFEHYCWLEDHVCSIVTLSGRKGELLRVIHVDISCVYVCNQEWQYNKPISNNLTPFAYTTFIKVYADLTSVSYTHLTLPTKA